MKTLFALLLVVMSVMTFLTFVNGYCSFYPPHYTLIDSELVTTCEHDHMEYMLGSVIRTVDCEECTCTESGMECCGFGYKAGAVYVPDGYKLVRYGCEFEIEKA